jgi:hypothetical protein
VRSVISFFTPQDTRDAIRDSTRHTKHETEKNLLLFTFVIDTHVDAATANTKSKRVFSFAVLACSAIRLVSSTDKRDFACEGFALRCRKQMISAAKQPLNNAEFSRRHTTIDKLPAAPQVNFVSFFCGLTAGVAQAGLFNPFDRALYLSVKNQVPFLRAENFSHPYQGFFQSVGHRALSGGLYYPLEQFFMTCIPPEEGNGPFYNFMAGGAAGCINALIVNPVSAVKYKTWGRDINRGMLTECLDMLRQAGLRPFGNGLIPTLARDLVFGGVYTFCRLEIQYRLQLSHQYQWTANFAAAALATVLSGPFNLARNVQYGTRSIHVAETVREVLINLHRETQERPTRREKWKHVQSRLRIGWGTARVAIGMAFGHSIYDALVGMYEKGRHER